eukprot:UN32779
MLLKHGAKSNQKNQYGNTSLMWAVKNGHRDIVQILIQYTRDLDERNHVGLGPLLTAVQNNFPGII